MQKLGGMASRNPKALTAALVASFVLMMLLSGGSSSSNETNTNVQTLQPKQTALVVENEDAITKKVGGNRSAEAGPFITSFNY